MPQIILKEKTANVGSYTFLQEMLITGYFCPVNIAKLLSTGFIIEHLQKQSFADIPQNGYS